MSTLSADRRPDAPLPAQRGRLENRLAAGSVASLASLLSTIGIAVVQVPILLAAWGNDAYGTWLLVTAMYSLIITFDLGHQNYVANAISMIGLGKTVECRRVLGSAIKVACVIGLIELLVAVAVAWSGVFNVWLPRESSGPGMLRSEAAISLVLLTLFFATFGSVGGLLVRLYVAGGRYARAQWIGIVQRLVMFGALVGAAMSGYSLAVASAVYVLAGSVVCIWTFYDVKTLFPGYWPWWQTGDLRVGVRHAVYSLGLTGASASDQLAATGMLAVAGSHVHAHGVAAIGSVRTLTNSIVQAAAIVALPLQPELSRFAATADHGKAAATLAALWMLSTTPICVAITAGGSFTEQIFSYWTRGRLAFSAILCGLLVAGTLVRQWYSPMSLMLHSANRIRAQLVISVIRTAVLLGGLMVGFTATSDVAMAGVAYLVSELAAAVIAMVYCRLLFAELHGALPWLSASLAGMQVMVSSIAMLFGSGRPIIPAVCLAVQLLLGSAQWLALPQDVKQRGYSLFLWNRSIAGVATPPHGHTSAVDCRR